MRKFAFKLQPVLDQRQRIEEERQAELAAALAELQRAETELHHLHARFQSTSDALRDGHATLTSDELRSHYAHLEYLDRAITTQHAIVGQRKAAFDRARASLVDAAKDRKVLETLRERRKEEHVLGLAVLEQNELDDSNARRFARAHRGGEER